MAVTAATLGQFIADQRAGGSATDGADRAAKQHIADSAARNSASADAHLLTAGTMCAAPNASAPVSATARVRALP